MESKFTDEEKGLKPEERGIAEQEEATSTRRYKQPSADIDGEAGIKLTCAPVEQSVVYHSFYPQEINPYLAKDPDTGAYYIHGNYEFYLERKREGMIFERVTFQKKYLYRQLKREFVGRIGKDKFVTEEKKEFVIDVDQWSWEPHEIEQERNAWVDPFGEKPFKPPSEWQRETQFREWLFEVKEHANFGRLYVKAIIEVRPEAFRIRHYTAQYLTASKWKYLETETREPYDPSTDNSSLDTGWIEVPPDQ